MIYKNTTYSEHPTHASKAAHKAAKKKFPTYDTSAIMPKKSYSKQIILSIIAIVAIITAVVGAVLTTSGCASTLAEGKSVEVVIDQGSTTSEIADKIVSAGVVSSASAFKNTVSDMGVESSLKPGTYIFEGGKTIEDYVKQLVSGPDSNSPKLVVSEGMTIKTIANELENVTKQRITASDFISLTKDASMYVNDYDFLKEAGSNSLEGYLFPKTYNVKTSDKAVDVIKMMLDQFKEETKDIDFDTPASKNLTKYDVLILASIVEKESTPSVKRRVASVFYNRLKNGMYLNSDATTAYEVGHDPTPAEVHADTPYSTYTNFGLPPTPICNPGKEAIEAACNPENTNYFYFFFSTNNEGETVYKFSETMEQHQDAIVELR